MEDRKPFDLREQLTRDPAGILTITAVCGAVVTLLPFVGTIWWVFDLFSHFRVQYFLGLLALSGLLLLVRRYRSAGVSILCCLFNLALILPLYTGRAPISDKGVEPVRAMLINVNMERGDIGLVSEEINNVDADILVLEEVSDRWIVGLNEAVADYPYSCVEPRGDNSGSLCTAGTRLRTRRSPTSVRFAYLRLLPHWTSGGGTEAGCDASGAASGQDAVGSQERCSGTSAGLFAGRGAGHVDRRFECDDLESVFSTIVRRVRPAGQCAWLRRAADLADRCLSSPYPDRPCLAFLTHPHGGSPNRIRCRIRSLPLNSRFRHRSRFDA